MYVRVHVCTCVHVCVWQWNTRVTAIRTPSCSTLSFPPHGIQVLPILSTALLSQRAARFARIARVALLARLTKSLFIYPGNLNVLVAAPIIVETSWFCCE